VRSSIASCIAAFGIVAAPIFAQPTSSPVQRISAADFAALPIVEKPLLSPDGHKIAALHTQEGKTTILIFDADHPEAPPKGMPINKTSVFALRWAGNRRLLLTIKLTQSMGDFVVPYLRLVSIDVGGDGGVTILDKKSDGVLAGDVLYTDPTGSWALVASQSDASSYPSVKRVDLATGAATVVEKDKEGIWDWYADDQGVVRAGVSYTDHHWKIWYRDKPGEPLQVIKGKTDENDDSAVDKFIFRGDESWVVTNEKTGRFGLYRYDTKNGGIGSAIFESPDVDVKDVNYDHATGRVKAVAYEDDRPRYKWLDAESSRLQERLDKALPQAANLPIDWSDDDQRALVYSSSGSDPGRYFLLDLKASRMSPVLDPFPQIDPALLAEVTAVHYHARDGLALNGYLTLPRGLEARGLPLILMPHGGPFERDHWQYDPIVQFLANRGYAVLQPEFRGSTGYGKSFVEKGYGEWGRKMQDDLNDGVDWLARSGRIDPKRVCIVGSSYGGYAAMWGAVRNPERYRCAASFAGVSDLPALLRTSREVFSATRYYREWRTKVVGVENVDLKSVSPLNHISELKVPLLIGHGEKDERVPVKQSRQMVDALARVGAPVSSIFYKDEGHGFDKSADLEDWLKRLEGFLAKYNPA
jgi:dipeptidyl aminopeptidase/acylaminoacyl peptidase